MDSSGYLYRLRCCGAVRRPVTGVRFWGTVLHRGRSFFYIRQGVGVGKAQQGTGRQCRIGCEYGLALFVGQAALDEAVDGIFFVDPVA